MTIIIYSKNSENSSSKSVFHDALNMITMNGMYIIETSDGSPEIYKIDDVKGLQVR